MAKFHWTKAAVKIAADRLRMLRSEGAEVTAEAVLADARDAASPLHQFFDWDVQRAAEAHWLWQAREIIRHTVTVRMVPQGDRQSAVQVRDWVPVGRGDSLQIVPISEAGSELVMLSAVVHNAREALEAWLARFELYDELNKAVSVVRAACDMLTEVEKEPLARARTG